MFSSSWSYIKGLTIFQVIHNIKIAQAGGTRVILNPAPARKLPEVLYPELTYLIMNESEAAILSGRPADAISASSDLDAIAAEFVQKGVANVIITLGAEGAYYQTSTGDRKSQPGKRVPAVKAKVVDTTAAGDTFVGAFAVKLATAVHESKGQEHEIIDEAVAFAIRAAGKTVEKSGAQSSIPWLNDL
jgi:ribokinase